MASIVGAGILAACSLILPAPSRYPDLWAVLISLYSFVHFFCFLLYFNKWMCCCTETPSDVAAFKFGEESAKDFKTFQTKRAKCE